MFSFTLCRDLLWCEWIYIFLFVSLPAVVLESKPTGQIRFLFYLSTKMNVLHLSNEHCWEKKVKSRKKKTKTNLFELHFNPRIGCLELTHGKFLNENFKFFCFCLDSTFFSILFYNLDIFSHSVLIPICAIQMSIYFYSLTGYIIKIEFI